MNITPSTIQTVHFLNSYLNNTENWIYNLLSNTRNSIHHIAAYRFLENKLDSSNILLLKNNSDPLYQEKYNPKENVVLRLLEKIKIYNYEFWNNSFLQNINTYIENNSIDIVHAHFGNIAWEMLEIKIKTNLPFIVSLYGWDYEKLPLIQPKFKEHYQDLFKILDGFICEGEHGAKILIEMGCPKNKIHIVKLGVKVKSIPYYTRQKKANSLNLIQIASFTEKKGYIHTINAFYKASLKYPNITLTLIGNERETGLLVKLKNLVTTLKLESKIKFHPPIDFQNLHTTLKSYDVFIHPSCYATDKDCEGGAPIVLLDAQATGMPVISTYHCDIPSEVIHQKTGILAEEKNIEELASAIESFYLMNNEEFSKYSNSARKHVEQNFDIAKNALKLDAVYSKYV